MYFFHVWHNGIYPICLNYAEKKRAKKRRMVQQTQINFIPRKQIFPFLLNEKNGIFKANKNCQNLHISFVPPSKIGK
jgi:hypothetical protein